MAGLKVVLLSHSCLGFLLSTSSPAQCFRLVCEDLLMHAVCVSAVLRRFACQADWVPWGAVCVAGACPIINSRDRPP